MNPSSRWSLAFTAFCVLTVAAAPATGPAAIAAPKIVDRFVRTKAHIDALLDHRVKPEPLPAVPPNPFQLAGATTAATNGGEATVPDVPPVGETPPLTGDVETLARYVATLKLGGLIELNGRVQLMLNQVPRKEGDLIVVHEKDDVVYLQVIRLTPRELTLGYKDAVQVIPLKGG